MKTSTLLFLLGTGMLTLLARLGAEPAAAAGSNESAPASAPAAPATSADPAATTPATPPPSADPAQPDEQMQLVLDTHAAFLPKPIEALSAEEARKQPTLTQAVMKIMKDQDKKPEKVGDTDNRSVELAGHKVKVRVYSPEGKGPFPVILYIHGGGWVIADLDTYDASARALCNAVKAVVVSTHYRQAPEHPFPASHEDVFGVYQWTLENRDKLNFDSKRIAVVGESAGGNMAAAISLMAKERSVARPLHQVLVYPVADMTGTPTPSKEAYANAKPLNKPMLDWFGKQLLAKPEDAASPHLSLLKAGDALKDMPRTTILLAQIDPLRSEGEMLARQLQDAGVQVNLKVYPGVTHEFFGMGAVVDKAKEAVNDAAADLRAALDTADSQ